MNDFMDRHFKYLKAGQKEYTEAEVRSIIDGAIQEERDACIRDCDSVDLAGADDCIAAAIRARGQG